MPTIAFIMDGNRRFAKKNSCELTEAYKYGLYKIKEVVEWSIKEGFTDICLYAFSKHNWKRKDNEIAPIFELTQELEEEAELTQKVSDAHKSIRFRFIGNRASFPDEVQKSLARIEEKTQENAPYTVWIAVSYNGRDDILEAVKQKNITTQEELKQALSTKDMEDPQLIIRTGGVHRLSGFLLWEAEYSELYFVDDLWPELSHKTFTTIITTFKNSSRNLGV